MYPRPRAKSQINLATQTADTDRLADQTKASSWPLLTKAGKKMQDPDEVTLTCGQSFRNLFKRLLPKGSKVAPGASEKSLDKLDITKRREVQVTKMTDSNNREQPRRFKRKVKTSKVFPSTSS